LKLVTEREGKDCTYEAWLVLLLVLLVSAYMSALLGSRLISAISKCSSWDNAADNSADEDRKVYGYVRGYVCGRRREEKISHLEINTTLPRRPSVVSLVAQLIVRSVCR